MAPQMLAVAMWANNTGDDDVDSAEAVRSFRVQDQRTSQISTDAQDLAEADEADKAAITAKLLAALGLGG